MRRSNFGMNHIDPEEYKQFVQGDIRAFLEKKSPSTNSSPKEEQLQPEAKKREQKEKMDDEQKKKRKREIRAKKQALKKALVQKKKERELARATKHKKDKSKKRYFVKSVVKHPLAPKQSKSAYNFYFQEQFQERKAGKERRQLVSEIAKEWRGMGEKQKQTYEEMAKVDKCRYEEEKFAFCQLDQFKNVDLEKVQKEQEEEEVSILEDLGKYKQTLDVMFHNKKDLKKYFKKPSNPYITFYKKRFVTIKKEFPKETSKQLNKRITEEWKKMDENEKDYYIEEYQDRLKDYQIKKQRHIELEMQRVRNEKAQTFRPFSQHLSGYIFFSRDKLNGELKEVKLPTEKFKVLGEMWKNNDQETHDKYQRIHKEDEARFTQDCACFQMIKRNQKPGTVLENELSYGGEEGSESEEVPLEPIRRRY